MALYAYVCIDCQFAADYRFPMGEAPHEFTDEVSGHRMRRIILPPTIQGETVAGGVSGGSGDGYLLDSKTGLTSKRPRSKKWV